MTYQLVSKEQDGFQAEFSVAEIEEIFEGRAKVKDHGIVATFGSKPSYQGQTDTTCDSVVYFVQDRCHLS